MAFIEENEGTGENPLEKIKGVFDATINGFEIVDNKFHGKLFRENEPESENNRPNPHKTQYQIDVTIHTPYTDDAGVTHDEVKTKVWANPTVGERAKLREIAEAAEAWVQGPSGKMGLDDELLNNAAVQVHVKDGKIKAWLPKD